MKGKVFFTKININYFLSRVHPWGMNPAPRCSGKADGKVNVPSEATFSSHECVPKGQLAPPSKS